MELLAIVFLWPFLILAAGLVFVALFDVFPAGLGFSWILILLFLFLIAKSRGKHEDIKMTEAEQLEVARRFVITFSIALLIPIFIRYLVDAFSQFGQTLPVVIAALIISFGLIGWGMFSKGRFVLMWGNIVGGALSLVYLYALLWDLGDVTRIVAAAFGLLVAVVISVVKLRDKLV